MRLHMRMKHPKNSMSAAIGESDLMCAYCKEERFTNKPALLAHTKRCKHNNRARRI